MELTANKGEWSELYAFLKILSEKRLYSADESLTLLSESFLKVLSILRNEGGEDLSFEIDESKDEIHIKKNDLSLGTIPVFKITSKLSAILQKIKNGSGSKGTFTVSEAESLMKDLHCSKIAASAGKKADIVLTIEDPHTGTRPKRGFSIKSKIGGLSTLLNASGATNFEYEIIESQGRIQGKPLIDLDKLLSDKEQLKFVDVPNAVFRKNLSMIDSGMPKIMGEMVKAYYLGLGSSLTDLTDNVEKLDPLRQDHQHFYEHKVQELLLSVAFGMQPAKLWNGSYETHGGYIIVKDNGELACYHVYDRDRFKKFLYRNTKFETPSRSRHNFGSVYERAGRKYLLLNLQIRFKE